MYTRLLFASLLLVVSYSGFSQDQSNFTHYFMNPYLINPSYAGTDGRASLSATYKKQWIDIEGAPAIGNFTFHTPTGKNLGFGMSFTNAQRGLLNTTSGYLTTSYGIWFSENVGLRFGISGGVAYNGVDIEQLENISDPAISDVLDQNLYLVGNAGLSLQIKSFNIGASIPNLFTDEYTGLEDFTQGEIEPLENLILFASNRFYLQKDGKFIFEPFFLYRHSDVLPPQMEASAVFHIANVVWLGGTYKQDFGISGFGGIKLNELFSLGYSYSLANTGDNQVNSASHEINLNLLLGSRNKDRLVYSFTDTSRPKKKSKRQEALEQQREEAAKRKAEEEAKKAEEERIEEEERKEEEARQERLAEEKRQEEERLAAEQEAEQEAETVEELPEEQPEEQTQERPAGNLNEQQSTNERVIVSRGNHLLELAEGEYVVVGVFSNYEGAEAYSDQLFFKGYQSKFGYITEKGLWYVYLDKYQSIDQARQNRDELRKSAFPNAWVITIQ